MSKIVIITNIPSPYRVDLFYYLQTHEKEYEFHIVYTSRNEDNRAWDISEEKLLNTRILNAKIIKIKNNFDTRYVHIPANICKVLSELKPDVVVAMEYNPAALQALFWAKTHGKKFIHWTDGTLHSERNIGKVQKLTRKIICANADACIASSTKAKEKLLAWGVPEEKIFISLLTVDISQYRDVKREPVPGRILYVGSMIRRKGLDLLIAALKYVEQDHCLHIVGNGTKEQQIELEQQAKQIGVSDRINFCGFQQGEDLVRQYAEAQVFVLPTREDCFGLVLLEAMCMGVPVISSKYADGAYDVILQEKNGMIVNPFDDKKFAQAIEAAITGEAQLTGSEQAHIGKFRFEQVVRGYVSAIDYALEKRKEH